MPEAISRSEYAILDRRRRIFAQMQSERTEWFSMWREVSDYFLPHRYPWLMTQKDQKSTATRRNKKLLDGTSTLALRILSSGMMNSITSPARPWFSLRIPCR